MHAHNFPHGVDYYGSFLGIKNNFTINVFDDIEYLNNSEFFNKNKNKLFKIDDYEHLFQNETQKLKPIIIEHNTSARSQMSIASFDNKIFDGVFEENTMNLNDLRDLSVDLCDLVDLTNAGTMENNDTKQLTLKSNSTCSSRSSHTENDDRCDDTAQDETGTEENAPDAMSDEDTEWEDEASDSGSGSYEEEQICARIEKFPKHPYHLSRGNSNASVLRSFIRKALLMS